MARTFIPALSGTALFGFLLFGTASADTPGNRYDLPRLYNSEISAAKAYLLTNHDRGNSSGDDYSNAVIIDVRRIAEHVEGHPPGAYSIPFPHVQGSPDAPNDSTGYIGYDISGDIDICFVSGCDDDSNNDGTLLVADFVSYVEATFPDKSTPILTLCKTGYRSVQAANVLQKAGYTDVRNIWEGFIGQPKYAYSGSQVVVPLVQLDLNNDGALNEDDKDGWSKYQELPTTTKLHPQRIFSLYSDLY